MPEENKFPSEVVDLPSGGIIYGKDSPLKDGKVEIKYMTAKEEDILTSANLIKKGVVIDKLLDSLILTKGITSDDLLVGDKNAVMVAARVLAYGPEYITEVTNPADGSPFPYTFNLTDCPFKELPKDVDYSKNEFDFMLPTMKTKIKFKLITGKDERLITEDLKALSKNGISAEVTTRLRHSIVSVDGDNDRSKINNFVNDILSRDSIALRSEIRRISPDIDMNQEIEIGDESVKVAIPMAVSFFWPGA